MEQRKDFKALADRLLMIIFAAVMLTACGTIYDDMDDCSVKMLVRFKYDYNMKFADAFSHEVRTVHLCAYDESGKLVLEKQQAYTATADQTMDVSELTPGRKYTFNVWAEGDNRGDSYDFGSAATFAGWTAKLKRDNGKITGDLTPLFHGQLQATAFANEPGSTQTIEVPLMKDTKNIKLVLQQINGTKPLNADDFIMQITDDNGLLAADNSLMKDEQLTYSPWSTYAGEAGIDQGDTKASAVVAEFTVNRLVKEGHKPRLTVWKKGNSEKPIFSVPLVDYFLLVKGNYNRAMGDQEYLDRQDTYDLVFFLENGSWISSYIYINSWRVVLQKTEI